MHRTGFRHGGESKGTRSTAEADPPSPAKAIPAPMAAFTALPHHQDALDETNSNTIKCIPDYRNRIKRMIVFWKSNYPDYYEQIVVPLTPEQKANTRFYYNAEDDLRYNILDPLSLQNFMSATKTKPNGKEYSYDHIRKYHDAILYCAAIAKLQLPPPYRSSMKAYLENMKKEKATAKIGGKTDEQEADPIPFVLYKDICQWSLESGNLMLWTYTITQWNCMGRSCNIAPLGFRNISRKEANDSIAIKYEMNKQDQTGVNTSPKNCYANPFEPAVCIMLAMDCYLCVNDAMFDRESDSIFRKSGKDRSASDTYCKALNELISSSAVRKEVILQYIRDGHFHAHGTRKGAATFVTTATMEPPPMPSILMRGEWSLGKVLDLYWKWSALGDCYLGRCLSGLDPDSEDFAALPPHFKEGMENKYIKEAMELCFGTILESWSGKCSIQGVLLLCLASMVHHRVFLLGFMGDNSRHPFSSIPILQRTELLDELAKLVTMEPVGSVITATGVPFRVKEMKRLNKVFNRLEAGIENLLDWSGKLPSIIKATVNEIAKEAGQVTVPFVMELLEKQHANMAETIGLSVLKAVKEATSHFSSRHEAPTTAHPVETRNSVGGMAIGMWREYRGFVVPPNFLWPTCNLRRAWDAWLFGMPNHQSIRGTGKDRVLIQTPVRPLRYIINLQTLPKDNRVRTTFRDNWKPVLKLMDKGTKSLTRGVNVKDMDAAFMDRTFEAACKFLKGKYPSLFEQERNRQWAVSNWSKLIRQLDRVQKKRKHQSLE